MAFKDLLLQLPSYPEPTSPAIIDQAVTFAEALGARLTALTFEADLSVPFNPLANALLRIPQMVAAERAKSVANARDLVSLFEAAASRHGVPAGHVIDQCLL